MDKKILKIDVLRGKLHNQNKLNNDIKDSDIIDKTKVNVDVNIEGELGDSNETSGSDEKARNGKKFGTGVHVGDYKTSNGANISVGITVNQMVKETEEAIKKELMTIEKEIKLYKANKSFSVFDFNNKIKRVRFLNQILYNLKHLVKVTEDYIVNLWKQFVQKN